MSDKDPTPDADAPEAATPEASQGVDNRLDALGALGFVAFGALIIGLAAAAPKSEFTHDAIGPWAIPVTLAIAIIVLGLLQAVRSYRLLRSMGRVGPHEGSEDEPGHPAVPVRAFAFIAAGLAYPFLLPVLGFLLTTIPLVAAGLWALHFRRPVPLVIATVSFTVIVYLLFAVVLGIRLPPGFIGWP